MYEVSVVMRQHNIWCVYLCSVWRGMPDCSLQRQRTHTHHMLCCCITTL